MPDEGSIELSLQSDNDEQGEGEGGGPLSLSFFSDKAGQTRDFRRLAERARDRRFGMLSTRRLFRRS